MTFAREKYHDREGRRGVKYLEYITDSPDLGEAETQAIKLKCKIA